MFKAELGDTRKLRIATKELFAFVIKSRSHSIKWRCLEMGI